jgi:hypothetical protein
MGAKDVTTPFAFFVISIIGVAITSITVKTYLDTKKEKDTNFNFSATVLAISLVCLFVSGYFTFKAFKGTISGNNAKVNNGTKVVNNAATAAAGSMAPQPMYAYPTQVQGVPVAQPVTY